jgi:hypothetical protein
MGMRMDQHFGLNPWASNFVLGEQIPVTEKTTRIYPDGTKEEFVKEVDISKVKKEPSGGLYVGMFEDEFPLYRYTFPDERTFFEAVQSDQWSSGPCFFLALKDENGEWVKESLWDEEEIENA